jgi:transposase, IS5 family
MGPKPADERHEHDLLRMELLNLIAHAVDGCAAVPQARLRGQRRRRCRALVRDPYWQHFSGERYFRHELPCDASSLTRWRQRIGEEGCEWLLAQSIEAARRGKVIKRQSLEVVVVDTTVQEKAIAHPIDSGLLNKAREQLVAAALRARQAVQAHAPGLAQAAHVAWARHPRRAAQGAAGRHE